MNNYITPSESQPQYVYGVPGTSNAQQTFMPSNSANQSQNLSYSTNYGPQYDFVTYPVPYNIRDLPAYGSSSTPTVAPYSMPYGVSDPTVYGYSPNTAGYGNTSNDVPTGNTITPNVTTSTKRKATDSAGPKSRRTKRMPTQAELLSNQTLGTSNTTYSMPTIGDVYTDQASST